MKSSTKKAIIAGSALALSAPSFVFAAFTAPTTNATGLPAGTLTGIITSLMNWLLIIVGIVAVIAFLIAGILYLTSAGDEGRVEKAKEAMIAAIIGIIVALAGLIALNAINTWLKGSQSDF
jgi:hypothetical protein